MSGPGGRLGLAGEQFGEGKEVALAVGWRAGLRIEASLVRFARANRFGKGAVDFQIGVFGAITTTYSFVLTL